MPPDNRPPRLGSDTLRSRARASGQIAEAKSQTRQRVAEDFETQEPEDVPVALEQGRLQPTTEFLDMARPMEAAAEFERQTPLRDVDPQRDIAERGGGFGLATPARRRLGAIELDEQFPRQDLTAEDIDVTDNGLQPEEDVQRRKAAREFEQQTPLSDIDPFGGLKQTGDGFALAGGAASRLDQIQTRRQRQQAIESLDEQTQTDVGRGDITRQDGGFGLTTAAQRDEAAAQVDSRFDAVDVGDDDLQRVDGGFRATEDILRQQAAADLSVTQDEYRDLVESGASREELRRAEQNLGQSVGPDDINVGVSPDQGDLVDTIQAYQAGDVGIESLQRVEQAVETGGVVDPSLSPALGRSDGLSTTTSIQFQREQAANEFEQSIDADVDVRPSDLVVNRGADGVSFDLTRNIEEQAAVSQFNQGLPGSPLTVGDVRPSDDGFELDPLGERRAAAANLESETPLQSVDPRDDLKRDGDDLTLRQDPVEDIFAINPDFTF